MARRFLILLLVFGGMVAGIEGLQRASAWWQGVSPPSTFEDYALIATLPVLVILWWKYLSPFGMGRGACLESGTASPHSTQMMPAQNMAPTSPPEKQV